MNVRILVLLAVVLSASSTFGQTGQAQPTPEPGACALKSNQLDAVLNLSFLQFDQDQAGGWRELQSKGCDLAAAMLIDSYIVDAPEELKLIHLEDLYFRAGQLYAWAGLKKVAARRFLRSLNLHERGDEDLAWNPYVLATVAFLQGDREGLAHQRQLLASAKATHENKINLGVVDGLARCFDKPYRDAYSAGCREPAK
jgi:hypothetical protein